MLRCYIRYRASSSGLPQPTTMVMTTAKHNSTLKMPFEIAMKWVSPLGKIGQQDVFSLSALRLNC